MVFASENEIPDKYPQKHFKLSPKQQKILQESMQQVDAEKQKEQKKSIIKGSTTLENKQSRHQKAKQDTAQSMDVENPYAGLTEQTTEAQEKKAQISFKKQWIYGTAVITTTFLDGSIKRSYGVLLRDGMFVTSANMVYDKNVYARSSYAMMQDDSSLPFICVAKLSIKALDLQKGLAILETLNYTDMYCNERPKSFYHDRIYSSHWVDVFKHPTQSNPAVVYAPYITPLNSFATEKNILQENLKQVAQKESNDFEGYKYAYGKGFYTHDGKLLGIVGASNDNVPKLIRVKEISDFLCELKERKILKNPYLQEACTPSNVEELK